MSTRSPPASAGLRLSNRRQLNRLPRRLPRVARRIDVLHPTWYYPDRLPAIGGPPMAVTIVDMIPELLPDLFVRGGKHLAKEAYARRAAAILCISESTRRDLLELYGPLDAVIEVVHLAAGSGFSPGRTSALELPADYVLFVGSRGAYKDFAAAADAFAAIRDEQPGVELVVGRGRSVHQGRAREPAAALDRRLGPPGRAHRR